MGDYVAWDGPRREFTPDEWAAELAADPVLAFAQRVVDKVNAQYVPNQNFPKPEYQTFLDEFTSYVLAKYGGGIMIHDYAAAALLRANIQSNS